MRRSSPIVRSTALSVPCDTELYFPQFFSAKHLRRHDQRSGVGMEERRSFIVAVDSRLRRGREEPKDHRTNPAGFWFWLPFRAFGVDPGSYWTERRAQGLGGRFEAGMDKPDEGKLWAVECVADGRAAAGGIPADQSFGREAHALQGLGALGEGDVSGYGLNHIGPAALVEDVAFVTQPLREGLTVAAIADDPIGSLRPVNKPLKVAATALEGVFDCACHMHSRWHRRLNKLGDSWQYYGP
jgi:hypothetical protein